MENNILSLLTKDEKKLTVVKTYQKGDVIFREGELCNTIAIVVSGEVKISSTTFSGNEQIFNVIRKDEIFGNNLIFSSDVAYKGDVSILKDSTIVFISKENLLNILRSNREFMLKYLNIQSNIGKKLNSTIRMLSIENAEERFRYYLFINNGHIEYDTVTSLAGILHLQRETLSRILTRLEKKNAIRRSSHSITLLN